MTGLPNWAMEKAQGWCNTSGLYAPSLAAISLARLLVEVDDAGAIRAMEAWNPAAQVGRETTLAEVRRVVEEQIGKWESHSVAPIALRDVLARLDALK